MELEPNVRTWVSDASGLVVPGTERLAHNVFTDFGREWLKQAAVWDTIATPIAGQSGAAANVIAGAPAGQKRVSGLTGMTSGSVGRFLTLINSGDNDGTFQIAGFVNATTVDVTDASPGTIPDANNGSIEWLESDGGGDTVLDDRKLRWLGVGDGVQLELTSVDQINSPLSITTGPDTYLRELGTRTEPTDATIRYTTVFSGAGSDFDHHGASVDVTEAAIFVDVHDGGGTQLDPTVATNTPVAYVTFDPVTKADAQDLNVIWDFRF